MTIMTKKRQAVAVRPPADATSVRACAACAHYVPVEGTELPEGICRRHPPLPFLLTNGNVRAVHPPVRGDWSCGEFGRRDRAPE